MRNQLIGAVVSAVLALGAPATGLNAQNGEPTVPDWMSVDEAARTVSLTVVAGASDVSNYWNFNGFVNGEATIVVPVGYKVELTFRNDDPMMAHSIGVGELEASFPAMFQNPEPAFAGAMSSSPTDMLAATATGQSEVLTFTADTAGDYALICFIAGHATTGMWIGFSVSDSEGAGVTTH